MMKKTLVLTVGVFVLASAKTAIAVPVVPNFTQGSMTSNTETTSTAVSYTHLTLPTKRIV